MNQNDPPAVTAADIGMAVAVMTTGLTYHGQLTGVAADGTLTLELSSGLYRSHTIAPECIRRATVVRFAKPSGRR